MQLGAIPVYISDKHLLPWKDEIDWSDFCVLIDENNVESIDDIIKSLTATQVREMQGTLSKVYKMYFTIESTYNQIMKRLK